MTKNTLLFLLCVALLVSLTVHAYVGLPSAPDEVTKIEQTTTPAKPTFNIIFVTHDYGAGLFRKAEQGMKDACELVGAEGMFIGPSEYSAEEQVLLLEAAIAKKPDFIVTTRPEGKGKFDAVIRKAVAAGITVMTFNVNDPEAQAAIPLPHFGQDFSKYGEVWAEEVIKDLPEGGHIAVLLTGAGNYALDARVASFLKTLDTKGGGRWVVKDVVEQNTTDEDKILGIISAYHAQNSDIKGFYGADYYAHLLSIYAEQHQLQGTLKVGGSDLGPGFVDGLDKGAASFALTQNAYLQGFYPVIAAHLQKMKHIPPIGMDTGTQVTYPKQPVEKPLGEE